MKVTILSKELILPSSPTSLDHKTYKLSYIDQYIPPYYVSFILYYLNNESTNITQSEMIIKLKDSLSKTLTRFYPLAGRLSKDQNTIDCTDQGVQFLVSRVASNVMDIVRSPISNELNKLVLVETTYVEEQVAIQVNLFDCGGIAVGLSMSHRIADACSFSSFVSHWFAVAKGSESSLVGPLFDSPVLFPPVNSHENKPKPNYPTVHTPKNNLVTKRFVFSSIAIDKLKREVIKDDRTPMEPTRVEVVTALIWKFGTMALGDYKASVAFHMVNIRKKMLPILQDHQFGNIFQMAKAVTHDQTSLMASLVTKLRRSFEKIDNEYSKSLTGEHGVEICRNNFKELKKFMIQDGVGVFKFSSWCRLAVNESDFGWGKPVWVSIANHNDENAIVLMDSRCDNGIEAWVAMDKDNMQKFEQYAELQLYVGSTTS